jgi:Zn-dependent peptidase ImmA (M78 family)/transcriptional regulator with XRE-family HTH domain
MTLEFNGGELRLARSFHGFSLEHVAERVGKTRQYLHKLENGSGVPSPQLAQELSDLLGVSPNFFFTKPLLEILSDEQFHFRKLFTAKAQIKSVTIARGTLVGRLVDYLDKELHLPDVIVPSVDLSSAASFEEIERAAELCRNEWGLGLGPISNMTRLAEHVGAVVTTFKAVSTEVDALSMTLGRPVIVLNEAKQSICRRRFDIAHELGHAVFHVGLQTGDRVTEMQANRFASSLLLPRSMMLKLFPRPRGSRLDWAGLRDFKLTWKASKAAILYRARQLDLISEGQYKTGVIGLRARGESMLEFEERDGLIPSERPELLARSLAVLSEKRGIHLKDIAEKLSIGESFFIEMLGFDPRPDLPRPPLTRPALRLVA